MTLNEYILLGLAHYGLPVLAGVILLAALGGPLPATLLLLTAGTFVAGGAWPMWGVVALATAAAVVGDLGGYAIGRWGGQPLIARVSRWTGGQARVAAAEQVARRWGGIGVFVSRWLVTPLGPVVNLTSGMARYPFLAFVCFDIVGELVWVLGYVSLGYIFGEQIAALSTALGNATWIVVGLAAVIGLGAGMRRRDGAHPVAHMDSFTHPTVAPAHVSVLLACVLRGQGADRLASRHSQPSRRAERARALLYAANNTPCVPTTIDDRSETPCYRYTG